MDKIVEKIEVLFKSSYEISDEMSEKIFVILFVCMCYFFEIVENNRNYDKVVF